MKKPARAELKLLPLSAVEDHPDNPRLFTREEVVDAIAANLDGDYPQKHAVHVRPLEGDRYQLVSGHHRKRAALKKGLTEVWAWVEPMPDEAAVMELVLANNQGELIPLEIGLHALKCIPEAQGRKGKGLASYADKVGKPKQYLSQLRAAAEVYQELVKLTLQVEALRTKAQHLYEVHAADRELWPPIVQSLMRAAEETKGKDAWTVERTKEAVAAVKRSLGAIPDRWRGTLFPPARVAEAVILDKRSHTFFSTLASTATLIADLIEDHKDALPKETAAELESWLTANAGGLAWDVKELQAYRLRVEDLVENPLPPGVYDVLLADPPWRYDFAETDNRQVENQYPTLAPEYLKAMAPGPAMPDDLAPRIPAADNAVLFLWATAPKLREALEVMSAWGFEYKTHAAWVKDRIGMGYWFRGQHELLLVGVRGDFSPPPPELRAPSVVVAPRAEHSEKPDESYDLIRAMFPDAKRVELFQRHERPDWPGWGNEVLSREGDNG